MDCFSDGKIIMFKDIDGKERQVSKVVEFYSGRIKPTGIYGKIDEVYEQKDDDILKKNIDALQVVIDEAVSGAKSFCGDVTIDVSVFELMVLSLKRYKDFLAVDRYRLLGVDLDE